MPGAPKGTNPGACTSCKAPVLWCRTAAGKAMPLDPDTRDDGNIELRPQPPHGAVIAVYVKPIATVDMFAQPRYVSHFATCPNADRHRKKKPKGATGSGISSTGAPYVKGSDTSKAAAESIAPHLTPLQAKVLRYVAEAGRDGVTCDEIEIRSKLRHQTASARVRELVQKGRIVRIGKRATSSGRQAAVYAVEGGL